MPMTRAKLAEWFSNADIKDVATVGGKGVSLGEMFQKLSKIELGGDLGRGFCDFGRFLECVVFL